MITSLGGVTFKVDSNSLLVGQFRNLIVSRHLALNPPGFRIPKR